MLHIDVVLLPVLAALLREDDADRVCRLLRFLRAGAGRIQTFLARRRAASISSSRCKVCPRCSIEHSIMRGGEEGADSLRTTSAIASGSAGLRAEFLRPWCAGSAAPPREASAGQAFCEGANPSVVGRGRRHMEKARVEYYLAPL